MSEDGGDLRADQLKDDPVAFGLPRPARRATKALPVPSPPVLAVRRPGPRTSPRSRAGTSVLALNVAR
ncbi:hypothetical protein SHKM778_32460 [Streptomyces sp. KM77-8]|uniref:Uncharacterized protein n=1 Tax=Streptomyces haneummycinicus TaxID=3074435 RepID=A0AAT9HHL9_9ACTN